MLTKSDRQVKPRELIYRESAPYFFTAEARLTGNFGSRAAIRS
jgi:hypothetical protein